MPRPRLLEQLYDVDDLVYVDALDRTYDVRFISFKEIHKSTNTSGVGNVPEQMYMPYSLTFHDSIVAIGDEPQRDLL